MKTFLFTFSLAMVIGCASQKEIQVEMVTAKLVKIDTVYRQPTERKMLTWRDNNNVEYVSFVAMNQNYIVGTRMMLLRQR